MNAVNAMTLVDGLPVIENRLMPRREVATMRDPRPGGEGRLVLLVGDLLLFRTRVELARDIREMFDHERVRLGLPVSTR